MKSTLRIFALAAIAASATAAFAADAATVNVPFSFQSQGEVYPAGNYDVTLSMHQQALTLRSRSNTKKAMMLSVAPADWQTGSPIVRIKFDASNGAYNLRTIQYGTRITPVLDVGVKHGGTVEVPFATFR